MPYAWSGPDPVEQPDTADYELATKYVANVDITVTDVRVWAGPNAVAYPGRRGTILSAGGATLGSGAMSTVLLPGWTTHALDAPVEIVAGSTFGVSYSTGGRYGALTEGLLNDVVSADSAVTAPSGATGNGLFSSTPGQVPVNPSPNRSFYGVDIVYSLGIGGNTAPRILSFTTLADGADVTASLVAEDDQGLTGAQYRVDWGDGTTASVGGGGMFTHTYAAAGLYGLLGSVTDGAGATAYAAAAVDVALDAVAGGLRSRRLIEAVVDHVSRTGAVDRVNAGTPVAAPPGVTASVYIDQGASVERASGLASTSALTVLGVRLQHPLITGAPDRMEDVILDALDLLMTDFNGDFDLGGAVDHVDVFGIHGQRLAYAGGYLVQDGIPYRVLTIQLPLITHDAWPQQE